MTAASLPARLRRGDRIRVVAPASSRAFVLEHDNREWIEQRFADMGLSVDFGAHVDERDIFDTSSVRSRVEDLHAAFADPDVQGILSVIGGYTSNELLPFLDFDLIRSHPKVLCGYSDMTALQNAIQARTGLVTFSGPAWSSFGMRDHFEPTGRWFRQALFESDPVELHAGRTWTDDLWFLDQDDRHPVPNPGWQVLREGNAEGRIVGGNLGTLFLLQGTPWMPDLDGSVLFLEDDADASAGTVLRCLVSLLQQPGAAGVRGLVMGRFQSASEMEPAELEGIVARIPGLQGMPVVTGVDFGHTSPMITFPIGGRARLDVTREDPQITVSW